jgi:hypothetical protein
MTPFPAIVARGFFSLWVAAACAAQAAAPVVISEFMAKNSAGLTDEDGKCRDWIELRNTTDNPVNLAGWFLANTTNQANWWTFPATNLAARSYLVVFASGKDRGIPGLPLHTSFQLEAKGEYLALIEPDGLTLASEFAPYPPQYENVSYGTGMSSTTDHLVKTGASARFFVPTDDSLAKLWTQPDFDDSNWPSGPTGLGFDANAATANSGLYAYWPIEEGSGQVVSNGVSGGASGQIQGATWTRDPVRGTVLSFDGQSSYVSAGTLPKMGLSSSNFTWSFWYRQRTAANLNAVVLGNRSGGGGEATQFIKFTPSNFEYYHNGDAGFIAHLIPNGTWLHLAVVKNGAALRYFENGVLVGGSTVGSDLSANPFYWGGDPDAAGEFSDGLMDDISLWTVALSDAQIQQLAQGASPLALNTVNGYAATSIQMRGQNASAYARLAFTVPTGANYSSLQLRMRYDDGFAAFLNGIEVARQNAPADLRWDSAATAAHATAAAIIWETFNLAAGGTWREGANCLAIQGLNLSATDPDFLLLPELDATAVTELGPRYFPESSPNAANGEGYIGLVEAVQFDHERGFYDAPFPVTLTCPTPEAEIRYTTNGTEPSVANGWVYRGPIPVNGNTYLRAGAFKTGWLAKATITQTYLFLDEILAQTGAGMPSYWGNDWQLDPRVTTSPEYAGRIRDDLKSLPIVSIVLDPEAFWGAEGIYTQASQRGEDYEKPCSAEMFFPDGSQAGFQINCGIHIVGSASRSMSPKHGVGLFFRAQYGPSKLKYRFFDNSKVEAFDSLAFRPNFNMSWVRTDDSGPLNNANADGAERTHAIYVRDPFTKDSQRAMGGPSAHERFVHLYIDGLYWGLYNPSERTDASFAAAYLGGNKDDYDAIFSDPSTIPVATDGDKTAWNEMLAIAQGGLSNATAYARLQQYANVTNLADYMLLNFYCATVDWPWQNWNAARQRETNAQFHFFVWDAEYTLETPPWVPEDRTAVGAASDEAESPAFLYHQLRQNAEWRLLFADRARLHLFAGGALTTNQTIPRFLQLCDTIDRAIVGESARWGDVVRTTQPYTRNLEWLAEKQRLLQDFFPQRTSLVINQLINADLYPNVAAPEFSAPGGAYSAPLQLTLSFPSGVVYYTTNGVDPRVADGAIYAGAQVYQHAIAVGASQTLLARARKSGVWSALAAATFTFPSAPPTLSVEATGARILISWPATVTDYLLESTDTLNPPRWTPVAGVSGNQVSLEAPTGACFFRLRK